MGPDETKIDGRGGPMFCSEECYWCSCAGCCIREVGIGDHWYTRKKDGGGKILFVFPIRSLMPYNAVNENRG
jgi:hypothetical protein